MWCDKAHSAKSREGLIIPSRLRLKMVLRQRNPVRPKMKPQTKMMSALPAALVLAAFAVGPDTSSASAAELSKFCKATATTVGLSAKDQFMAWCEAEARQVSGVPTEPPGPGMGRALRQN